MRPHAAAAHFHEKIKKNKKIHGRVPTQGHIYKIKYEIKKFTYQWGNTGYYKN